MNRRHSTDNDRGGIALMGCLVLIAMMGMGAIVLDGGFLAVKRRQIQAVADAAALAGGVALPTSATAISDARTNATKNGYTNGAGGVVVTVNSPYSANSNAIEVIVTKNVSTFLGKALKINTGTVTGRAVVQATPALPSIFANSTTCAGAACGTDLCINGSNITIQGSIHSNGSLTLNGNNSDSVGAVEYGSGCATHSNNGPMNVASGPSSVATQAYPLPYTLATFCPCSGANCYNIPGGNISVAGSWWAAGNGPTAGNLNPGIYCPSPLNAGVSLQLNGCTAPCAINGTVTFASDGPVQINGQGNVNLIAFSNNVVVYSQFSGGGNAIQIGAANLTLTGNVFARGGLIADNGTNLTTTGSFIGDSVQMGLAGSLTMNTGGGTGIPFLSE